MSATQTVTSKKSKKPAPPVAAAPAATTALVPKAPAGSLATANPAVNLAEWGVPVITHRDIIIPKIFAMQAMSKQVVDGKAKFGEMVDSLNNNVMGDTQKPIDIIPFYMEKVFVVMEEKDDKFKFIKQVPVNAENEAHEFEAESDDGIPQKWYRTQNVYAMIPSEVAAGGAIPYLISFRSTSAKAGQKISTTMYMKNLKAGKTPASMVMELSCQKTSNDKGTFIVLDVREKRASTDAEVAEAFAWVKTIKAGQAKVDHSDLEAEATYSAAPVPENTEF